MRTPTCLRPLSYWGLTFRRTWRSDLSNSLLNPMLYLASIGVGLGVYVQRGHHLGTLHGVSYLSFVAPALLATTAMQLAVTQATFPVLGAVKWARVYLGMLASPLSVNDVLVGHLIYIALRVAGASGLYLAVSAAFGTLHSPSAALELLIGPLVGLAFATPLAAFSIGRRTETSFVVLFRLFMVPLFLFSGTFFPITQLPSALRVLAEILPLWHGVELCRSLALGSGDLLIELANGCYLVLLSLGGYAVARRAYRRRLVR